MGRRYRSFNRGWAGLRLCLFYDVRHTRDQVRSVYQGSGRKASVDLRVDCHGSVGWGE